MRRINLWISVCLLILMTEIGMFYFYIRHLLQDGLCRMVGAGAAAQSGESLVSLFSRPELQGELWSIGKEHLDRSGYGVSGIDYLLSTTEFSVAFLLLACSVILVLLGFFLYVRHCNRSVLVDCDRMAAFLERSQSNEKEPAPAIRNEQIKLVLESAEQLLHTRNHQMETLRAERKSLNDFTQNVYHQIKTPLSGLKLYLEQRPYKEENTGECLKILDDLFLQITTLLNIGKLESKAVEIAKKTDDLSILVEDAIYAVGALEGRKNIEICSELQENALYCFNYFWMREAVENLLVNSCQYSEPEKKIWVTLKSTRTGYLLTIDDQAGGLKTENPFERYATSDQYGKYGIGLHLTKVIVEKHFGTIQFKENERDGTSFLIHLPILKGVVPY